MSIFQVDTPLPPIPDNLILPQFMLREISGRPVRPRNVPFFIDDSTGRTVSYEEVHHWTYSLANSLSLRWNIGLGDVVCIFSPNHVDYMSTIWAIHTLGGVVTPSNPSYSPEELAYQLKTTNTRLIIAHPLCLLTAAAAANLAGLSPASIISLSDSGNSNGYATTEELIAFGASRRENYRAIRLKPGEGRTAVAFLAMSSGTTGKPKAVVIPHYSVIANIIQLAAHFRINDPSFKECRLIPGDVAMAVLPMFHIYGLVINVHFSLYSAMSILVVPKFNLGNFLESIVKYHVTHLHLVPPHIVLLCKQPIVRNYDLEHVKFCMSGAAPLGGELLQQVSEVLPNATIGQAYGMTETSPTISAFTGDGRTGRIGSSGMLMPGYFAKVIKPDGSLAKEGEGGELLVKSPSLSLRYLNNPSATAETYVDGWVRTGDEVIIKDNEVYVVDRLKEVLKVRGFQVSPAELEAHLLLHPDVSDVCVVGVPDDYSGEIPMAFIVPSTKALEEMHNDPTRRTALKTDIVKHVSDAMVKYKHLAGGIEYVDAIPKNPSGKILRRILREQARQTRKKDSSKL